MEILKIIIALFILIVVTFIIGHSWIFICDFILGGLKKLFHIRKKETIKWHPIIDKSEQNMEDKKEL